MGRNPREERKGLKKGWGDSTDSETRLRGTRGARPWGGRQGGRSPASGGGGSSHSRLIGAPPPPRCRRIRPCSGARYVGAGGGGV